MISIFKVRKTLLYIFVASITCANFEVFVAYSNEHFYHITPLFEGEMITVMFVMTAFFLVLYNSAFANIRTRRFSTIAIVARVSSWAVFAAMV